MRRLLTLVLLAIVTTPALAHRLLARYQLLSGQKVRVEGRFETGDVPLDSEVKVLGRAEKVLREGALDERGFFEFRSDTLEDLHIIVSDGTGHRAEVRISAVDLLTHWRRDAASQMGACLFAPATPLATLTAMAAILGGDTRDAEEDPVLAGGSGPPIGKVLLGVVILLGIAAGCYAMQRHRAGVSRETPRADGGPAVDETHGPPLHGERCSGPS